MGVSFMADAEFHVASNRSSIGVRERILYSLPAGSMTMLYGGPIVVLQGIYAKYYGLSLTTIALVLLIANLFDTVTDPAVGYWSDRFLSRRGTRKPFMVAGGIIFLLGAFFLFSPPSDVDSSYFLFYLLVFFLGFTLFNIPHYAWGNEISSDSHSSTRLFMMRGVAVSAGGMLFYSLPLLPIFPGTEFTPKVLQFSVFVAGALLVPALYLSMLCVPNEYNRKKVGGVDRYPDHSRIKSRNQKNIPHLWASIKSNKPFLLFLGALFLTGFGSGSCASLLFIFVDVYLQMGEKFSLISLMGMGASLFGMFFWSSLASRVGKKTAWVVGSAVTVVGIFSMLLLSPEVTGFVLLASVMIPIYIGATSLSLFAPAMLSDIVDYSSWKYGDDFAGSYFSVYFLITKTNVAIGGALGLALAGWFGFDPAASNHSAESVFGLRLAAIWVPTLVLLLSIFFIIRQPIDARRHAVICKALDRRKKLNITSNLVQ